MFSVKTLDLPIPADQLNGYQNLLEKSLWPCLQGYDPLEFESSRIYAVGAHDTDLHTVGIAIAVERSHFHSAELLALSVAEPSRNKGIGTRLLTKLQEYIHKKGCVTLSALYPIGQSISPVLEKIFSHLGWSPPKLRKIRLHFDQKSFHPPWVNIKYPLPKGFTIFPWTELKKKEKERLWHLMEQGAIDITVSPFKNKGQFEPTNSLGLRKNNEVIGWVITLRPDSDTVEYASVFIFPEYRYTGFSAYLLAASIRLHLESPIQLGAADLFLNQVDSQWVRFVKNRLLPYAEKVERWNNTGIILT